MASTPFVDFSRISEIYRADMERETFDDIPLIGGKHALAAIPDIVAAFADRCESPILCELADLCKAAGSKMFRAFMLKWPPASEVQANSLVRLILLVIQKSDKPDAAIGWFGTVIARGTAQHKMMLPMRSVIVGRIKNANYWGLVSASGTISVVTDRTFEVAMSGKISKVSAGPKCVKFVDADKTTIAKFAISEPGMSESWGNVRGLVDAPLFGVVLGSIPDPAPNDVLMAVMELVTDSDMVFMKAFVEHAAVMSNDDQRKAGQAIVDIFAFTGKMNQLLMAVVSIEFSRRGIGIGTIFRADSLVTKIMNVVYARYGDAYYRNTLKRIIDMINEEGDIGLCNPKTCSIGRAHSLVCRILHILLTSEQHVSPQIRHVLSIVRGFACDKFRSALGVYNSMSGTFLLRFMISVLSHPEVYDKSYGPNPDPNHWKRVVLPFVSLLQEILNLSVGRKQGHESFVGWTEDFETNVFPGLINFAFKIGDPPEKIPEYEVPSTAKLTEHLQFIIGCISKIHVPYSVAFKREHALSMTLSWNGQVEWYIRVYLRSFFADQSQNEISQIIPL